MIKTVNSFHEAAVLAKKLTDGKIFHLAGVLTLGHILEFIEPGNVVVRVLPSCYSITKCLEMGIPPENIIAMQGTFSKEFNQILMREYSVEAVITKESGITGGTPEKIEAALEVGVPLIIVERPEIPELYSENVHKSVEELVKEIISD
jgi:precorrin-6A/cobalt-precorrin-6A reductase